MDTTRLKTLIEKQLPEIGLKSLRESLVIENPVDLPRVLTFLKEHPDLKLDYLAMITASDYLTYLESVYYLYSMEKRIGPVIFRVRVPRENPKIPSIVNLYRGAELQERECYDMFGILYENHPDLRRLFFWENFEGFPLRKDFAQEDSEVLEWADIEWLKARGIKIPEAMEKKAVELKQNGQRALARKPGA